MNYTNTKNNAEKYWEILEIVGFSSLSFVLGVIYQKCCNTVHIN